MNKFALFLVILTSCSSVDRDPEITTCYFRGKYQTRLESVSNPHCEIPASRSQLLDEERECVSDNWDCNPGDPVLTCNGSLTRGNCVYTYALELVEE